MNPPPVVEQTWAVMVDRVDLDASCEMVPAARGFF